MARSVMAAVHGFGLTVLHGLLGLIGSVSLAAASEQSPYARAAQSLDAMISSQYAYLDTLPGGDLPQSPELAARRVGVTDRASLLAYAEWRLASLADHHAITGRSFRDSWAVVPTYADLWVVVQNDDVVIDAVRDGSPAAAAAVRAGDRVVSVEGVPVGQAIAWFWAEMGLEVTPARAAYAARVLLAGRRDRPRRFALQTAAGAMRDLVLPSLYEQEPTRQPPVRVCRVGDDVVIRFNNSLGDSATIPAFDEAMRELPPARHLILDLRDTPSGGNTTVARAILGWFVTQPHGYQVHNRPAEARQTGIARQWVEQVLPRPGLYRAALPVVLVGRWTGSMGEGLAIGFASMGARVEGTRMAGLKGSIEDLRVGDTDLVVKLPTERLLTVQGLPREDFVPDPIRLARAVEDPC